MQRYFSRQRRLHVGIIMDGNGRWALRRGEPRSCGHQAGGEAVRRVVEAAPDLGIGTLTLFAFSSANWQRPPAEVAALMSLFHEYLVNETELCREKGVRLTLIGRRDRLPPSLRHDNPGGRAGNATRDTTSLAIGGRLFVARALLAAARRMNRGSSAAAAECSVEEFSRLIAHDSEPCSAVPDVDLVIRTGGERRLSDFLLWESAFAELYFTDSMWPEFGASELAAAIADFDNRERRFGGLSAAPQGVPPVQNGEICHTAVSSGQK